MKVGVSSYSYAQAMKDGRLTIYEMVDKAAAMGFETMDFSGIRAPGETDLEAAPKLRKRCQDAGVALANYATGADFLGKDFKEEVARVKKEVDVAAALGVATMRHDASGGFPAEYQGRKAFADALPILADAYRQVTEYAATLGIRTMVENHGYYCQDSERVEKLIRAVDHENFGLLLDMGNFLCADEDAVAAVGRLAHYAFHVHAKDFHTKPFSPQSPGKGWFNTRSGAWLRGAIVGHGDVPIAQCVRLMQKVGYDGAIAIEFEGIEDCIMALEDGRENLLRMIG